MKLISCSRFHSIFIIALFIAFSFQIFAGGSEQKSKLTIKNKGQYIPQAQGKKYLIFDNLDEQFFVPAYWNYISQSEYGKDFFKSSFTDEFFKTNKMSDFDVAVLVLGDYALSISTETLENQLIVRINQMLDSGKSVMIIAKYALWSEFDPGSFSADTLVRDFFVNKLKLNYLGRAKTVSKKGKTVYFPVNIKGTPSDIVGLGLDKLFNSEQIISGKTVQPLMFAEAIDVFSSKSKDLIITERKESSSSDSALGARMQYGKGKLVLLSFGLESFADENIRNDIFLNSMRWLTGSQENKPLISVSKSIINFGSLMNGKTLDTSFVIENAGSALLKINNISFKNNQNDGFSLKTAPNFDLNPAARQTVVLSFFPTSTRDYSAILTINSNASNGAVKEIALTGKGIPFVSVGEDDIDNFKSPSIEQNQNYLLIKFNENQHYPANLSVIDLNGIVCLKADAVSRSSSFDLSGLPCGCYYLFINSNGKRFVKPIIYLGN